MPTKPLDRLLFVQGGACFFCKQELPKSEASVEHLVAVTHGGKDNDENCVACCKALNTLFGRMSLKEKIKVALNQKGNFLCPAAPSKLAQVSAQAKNPDLKIELKLVEADPFGVVVEDLQKRGNSRPGKPDRLLNTIRSTLISQSKDPGLAEQINAKLQAIGYVVVSETKVTYNLPKRAA